VTTRIHTNDPKYWSLAGHTLWTVWGSEGPGDEFTERTVTVSKAKGDALAGYGLVLCQGERPVREEGPGQTMLVILINNSGEYAIGKFAKGQYESLIWWTASPALRAGAGAPNELHVKKDGDAFVVEANGMEAVRFIDSGEPRHSGGRNGYVAVISPLDRFPEGEVDIYYTEKK
jgi:hypothetical protein